MTDLPRVSDVLKPFCTYYNVPRETLERAADRGTSVHALCAGIAKGNWIPDGMIDEALLGYVNSFKAWSNAQVKKFVIIEKRMGGDDVGYTGQMDMVIVGHDDELYLVDLKTCIRPQKTHAVQLAAYNNLLKHNKVLVKGAMVVYLNKFGEFPDIHTLDNMHHEFWVFQAALDCWYYFNKPNCKVFYDRDASNCAKHLYEDPQHNGGFGQDREGG